MVQGGEVSGERRSFVAFRGGVRRAETALSIPWVGRIGYCWARGFRLLDGLEHGKIVLHDSHGSKLRGRRIVEAGLKQGRYLTVPTRPGPGSERAGDARTSRLP